MSHQPVGVQAEVLGGRRGVSESPTGLSLHVRRGWDGPLLAREPVDLSDLVDPMAETWMDGCLRKGYLDVPLGAVRAAVRPVRAQQGSERPVGFALDFANPGRDVCRSEFPLSCLAPVAARAAQAAVARGELSAGDLYTFTLDVHDRAGTVPVSLGTAHLERLEPRPARVRLAPLLERARLVEVDPDADDFPVFYWEPARAKSERIARRGGDREPPVETGGLLVGSLASCPETGELFAVILDVLEAVGARSAPYSLTFSAHTWAQAQRVMKARRSHPSSHSQLILGQSHGHSFLPLDGAPPCPDCHERPVCSRTSAYLSADDRAWCRAVFSAQPWQLSHVYGLNGRAERVDAFFGQRGGQLVRRGHHALETLEGTSFEEGVEP